MKFVKRRELSPADSGTSAAGCGEAWVLTERDNRPAMRLYASAGGVEAPRDAVMFTFHLPA